MLIIAILEDEKRVANQLQKLVGSILNDRPHRIHLFEDLEDARQFIEHTPIDLLLLDLNLNGDNGFDLLKQVSAHSFQTIITSAYRDKALEAFEYGVLDFVPKPFQKERLEKAILRLNGEAPAPTPAKYLVIRQSLQNLVLEIEKVIYFEGKGHHTQVELADGRTYLHHKSLGKLLHILPENFVRIHKSYVVNVDHIEQLNAFEGSKYELVLHNGVKLPIGRTYYQRFKQSFI